MIALLAFVAVKNTNEALGGIVERNKVSVLDKKVKVEARGSGFESFSLRNVFHAKIFIINIVTLFYNRIT